MKSAALPRILIAWTIRPSDNTLLAAWRANR